MILNGNGKLAKREITALEDSYLSFEGALAGQLLQNVDEVLQTRGGGQGLKLYSRLYNDPHIQAALNRLAGSVTCKDWIVAPGGEKRIDQKAADLVRSQLANLNAFDLSLKEENHSSVNGFDQLTRAMIVSGRLNGYVCAEVMWSNRGGQTVASEIRVRDPRQFGFMRGEQGYVLRHLTRENSWTGETPPLKKILVWSYGALDGSPYGRALGEAIFWPHFFKRNIIKFNLKFLENYASPKVVGKYPRGSQTDQLATLNAAVNTIANETGISIPETMMLEYLQANASGTVDAYEKAIRYFDEQISEVILGETGSLSQSTGGGSRARDEVGAESGAMVAKAIADSLSSTFNRLARWITDFNLPQAMPPTIYRDFEQGEEITSRSGVDKVLFDLGYRLTPERVADVYGDGYEQAGGDDKEPALISSLGVGGVQALTGLLTQAATGQLPKENAIAVLVSVFGIAEDAAAKMVPDAPEKTPETNPLDQLFGGQGDGAGQQQPDPNAAPQFAEQLRHPKGDPRGGQFASKRGTSAAPVNFSTSTDTKKIKAAFLDWEESIKKLKDSNTADPELKIDYYKKELEKVSQSKSAARQPSKDEIDSYIKKELDYERTNNGRFYDGDPDLPEAVERIKSRFLKRFEFKNDDDQSEKIKRYKGIISQEELKLEKAKKTRAELGFSEEHSERIASLIAIHDQMSATLSSPNAKFSGVFDSDGNLQAIANITRKKGYVYVDYLMTAPHNLIPGDTRATKGAGSAAIESIVQLSAEGGRSGKIKLTALRDAVPFYKKIGFTQKDKTSGLPEMDLSSEAARQFLSSRGKSLDFAESSLDELEAIAMGALAMRSPNPSELPQFAEAELKDAAELIADKARPLVQDAIAPWLDQVRNFVEQSASLEEIRDGLVNLFPELDDAAFAEAMGNAMLLSDLAGREEVLQDDADVAFAEAIESALNGTLDFAAPLFGKGSRAGGKKPNCNPAKSHFCQTANGRGSCVPLSKKCKFKPTSSVKAAADYVDGKVSASTLLGKQVKASSISKDGEVIEKDGYSVDHYEISITEGDYFTSATINFDDGDVIDVTSRLDKLTKYTSNPDPATDGYRTIEKVIPDALDYDFTVDDSYDAIDTTPDKAAKIAATAAEDFRRVFAEIPDGQVIINAPYNDDGKGDKRAKIYKRMGFSDVMQIDGKPYQFSIKKGNFLVPYNFVMP
jgi:phage gp29-like protein